MSSFFARLKEFFVGGRKNRRIKVRVNLAKDASCWNYSIEADEPQSEKFVRPGNKIDLPEDHPSSVIQFRLQGKAGQSLDFDLADPIWVKEGDCPTSQGSVPDIEILSSSTANRLDIKNKNSTAAELHYRLNFVDGSGNKVHWDPIIRNGGGGIDQPDD